MLEKKTKNKISVLDKMLATEPGYTVPPNSVNDLHHKTGECSLPSADKTMVDLKTANNICPHCENMAKNFLYLESLIRTASKPHKNCSVCRSSLRYLQFVNQSIIKVFGNFDCIAKAAMAVTMPKGDMAKLAKQKAPPTRMRGGDNSHLSSVAKTKEHSKATLDVLHACKGKKHNKSKDKLKTKALGLKIQLKKVNAKKSKSRVILRKCGANK